MAKNQFVMVSDWLENGNLEEFAKGHADVDRLGLVCYLVKTPPPSITDNHMIDIAQRRRQGADLYA